VTSLYDPDDPRHDGPYGEGLRQTLEELYDYRVTQYLLETAFRHHRHHDLSIRLVTQTIDEFFEHSESETILKQCAVKTFHQLEGMDEELAQQFELNHAQMRFVQQATLGSEQAGHSQALLGVDGEWRGIRVEALPWEQRVIENADCQSP
jgi:type IV secretory pathway VirB4 component